MNKVLENRWAWLTVSVVAILVGVFLIAGSFKTSSAVGGKQIKSLPTAAAVSVKPSPTATVGATKMVTPTLTPTATLSPVPTAQPKTSLMSDTCRDFSGKELRVGQESAGLICLPGNKLFSRDGKTLDGIPSSTPPIGKR